MKPREKMIRREKNDRKGFKVQEGKNREMTENSNKRRNSSTTVNNKTNILQHTI